MFKMGHKAYLSLLRLGLVVAARVLNAYLKRGENMILKPNKYLKELGIKEIEW